MSHEAVGLILGRYSYYYYNLIIFALTIFEDTIRLSVKHSCVLQFLSFAIITQLATPSTDMFRLVNALPSLHPPQMRHL